MLRTNWCSLFSSEIGHFNWFKILEESRKIEPSYFWNPAHVFGRVNTSLMCRRFLLDIIVLYQLNLLAIPFSRSLSLYENTIPVEVENSPMHGETFTKFRNWCSLREKFTLAGPNSKDDKIRIADWEVIRCVTVKQCLCILTHIHELLDK